MALCPLRTVQQVITRQRRRALARLTAFNRWPAYQDELLCVAQAGSGNGGGRDTQALLLACGPLTQVAAPVELSAGVCETGEQWNAAVGRLLRVTGQWVAVAHDATGTAHYAALPLPLAPTEPPQTMLSDLEYEAQAGGALAWEMGVIVRHFTVATFRHTIALLAAFAELAIPPQCTPDDDDLDVEADTLSALPIVTPPVTQGEGAPVAPATRIVPVLEPMHSTVMAL